MIVDNLCVILFDPVDHVDGRWAVRRTGFYIAGRREPLWAAAGFDHQGRPQTRLFGQGVDQARQARRFAHFAATHGVPAADRAFGLKPW